MSLPLVDVNKLTVAQTWPLLMSAISSADFIALDLELSGLGWNKTKSAFDAAERYKLQCDVASSYGILSIGVACFQWQPSSDTIQTLCKVETFNIWLLSQHPYTIDPSSAKFLTDHGFDFNKQFCFGLPYTPVHASSGQHDMKLTDDGAHLPTLFAHLLCAGCPLILHNGFIDLLFLYSHLYAPLPPRLDVFTADLSEMCRGGVYDTKAIAEFLLHQQPSFLEYIFRKKQQQNMLATMDGGRPHLKLVFADYPTVAGKSYVELISIVPPSLPPIEELVHIELCPTFTHDGYCHRSECGRSHDVLISIALEEHKLELSKAKRKRKREIQTQRKRQKTSSENTELQDREELDSGQDGFVHMLECELSAAKARFGQSPHNRRRDEQDGTVKPSFGHRAGFDAFMTGYTFASIAVSIRKSPTEGLLSGLKEMENCLANRGKNFPLQITKSHFTSTSQQHRTAQTRINVFIKET